MAYVDEDGNVFQLKSTYDAENEAIKNPLTFYKNEESMFPDLKDKFELIDNRIKNQEEELPQLEYVILGNYLILKEGRKLEYMMIFDNPRYSREYAIDLNL